FTFTIPLDTISPPPRVEKVYPQSDHLPANQLKFYIFFSEAMAEGQAYRHLRVREKTNGIIRRNFFLELQPELWDLSHTRLTLWLEPGRIKRDLGPNSQLGPPLEVGKRYILEIDPNWKDRRGRALQAVFQKEFLVIKEDRQSPDPQSWQVQVPSSDTKSPLRISFGESLDAVLVTSSIQVLSPSGQMIEGAIQLLAEEKGITFSPQNPWNPGKYKLVLASKLEDLAGNNLNRLFDRDLKTNPSPLPKQDRYAIEFLIQ
ncbi:MAG: Ig-like domain-containing protein, partial [Bacteroidota bacterium]